MPRVSRREANFSEASSGWFLVSRGTGLQLMQFNNPASTKIETKNMTTLPVGKLISRFPLRLGLPRVQPIWIIRGFLLIPLAVAFFALSPTAEAVNPPPDGG